MIKNLILKKKHVHVTAVYVIKGWGLLHVNKRWDLLHVIKGCGLLHVLGSGVLQIAMR